MNLITHVTVEPLVEWSLWHMCNLFYNIWSFQTVLAGDLSITAH